MKLGEKIREARMKAGMTQEQAAEQLQVSRQTISNWENEKSLPDIVSVIKMSDLYQISLDDLLKGDSKMMEKIKKETDVVKSNSILTTVGWISFAAAFILSLSWHYTGNPVLEFISAAAPWVLAGLGIACTGVGYNNTKKLEKDS
ncbi:MAG: helix-turn-helix transcriptional regulator [Lachnospiraceae bacterium]|nr:helix-turn-helix transcriptional regulator [Lachnospiraceae bacterium]